MKSTAFALPCLHLYYIGKFPKCQAILGIFPNFF
nr:MAG TPA: hypothetical protein [Caudoviricetes sp.]